MLLRSTREVNGVRGERLNSILEELTILVEQEDESAKDKNPDI